MSRIRFFIVCFLLAFLPCVVFNSLLNASVLCLSIYVNLNNKHIRAKSVWFPVSFVNMYRATLCHPFSASLRAIDQEVTLWRFLCIPTYPCSSLRNQCFNNIDDYSSCPVPKIFTVGTDSSIVKVFRLVFTPARTISAINWRPEWID